jgi:hypothetical protein
MFNFNNLDDIDNDDAAPEWQKWEGKGDFQRAGLREDWAVLEEKREEQFAAADAEDEYVYEKLEIPFLPDDCFDPMGLADDTIEAVEESLACLNGQVVMNYVVGAFEDYLMNEYEKEQKKMYVDSLHEERIAVLESSGFKAKEVDKKVVSFDRKKFSWREIQTPLLGTQYGMPDGGMYAEVSITGDRVLKPCMKISGVSVLPNSALIQIMCAMGQQVRPAPSGRLGRNAATHMTLEDLFFPSCFMLEEGRDYLEHRKEAPNLVTLVLMSCNKEAGEVEVKNLLEGVKLASPASFGFKRPTYGTGLSAIAE